MPTPTRSDYALLSEHVYEAGQVNTLNLQGAGWEQVQDLFIEEDGFYGAVYKKGDQYVVAFRRTDTILAEHLSTNPAGALGFHTRQIELALDLVAMLQIHKSQQQEPVDLGNVTFTGHSLGGGLAGVMAILFDRPATTFAAAPFEFSVSHIPGRDIEHADVLKDLLRYFDSYKANFVGQSGMGVDPAFQAYMNQWGASYSARVAESRTERLKSTTSMCPAIQLGGSTTH